MATSFRTFYKAKERGRVGEEKSLLGIKQTIKQAINLFKPK